MRDKRYEWIESEKVFDVFCAYCDVFILYAKTEADIPNKQSEKAYCEQCLENGCNHD